jgi:uncharacterized membrane-anchored protein YjiN (DUF445 family)
MLEPLSLAAVTVANLIFSKVLEKSSKQIGEQLAEAASNKVGQLLNLVQEKFQEEGVEGKLTKAQEEPSETKIEKFKNELVEQMSEDEVFAQKMQSIIDELKEELKDELQSDEQLKQIFLKDVVIKGDAEIGGISQEATRGGNVTQEAVTGVQVGGNFKIGNISQKG